MFAIRFRLAWLIAAGCFGLAAHANDDSETKRLPKANDRALTELERDAAKCRTARLALDKYETFVACHDLTPPQRQSVEGRMKVWQKRVDAGLWRVGAMWVTPEAAKEIGKAADLLIVESYEKITAGEYKKAKELLERAVRTDPSGTRADYVLGLLNSPNGSNYAPWAEKHFEHAYRRDPENVALANNLALSKIKMGQYGEALDLWGATLRTGIELPDVVQNLSRFVREAKGKRIPATDGQRQRAEKLLEKALKVYKGPPPDEKIGWLYSPLVLSPDESARSELSRVEPTAEKTEDDSPDTGRLIEVGSGSGFVIAPGIVLTNRHVAEGGTSFRIADPAKLEKEYPARILAICPDMDLAILRCDTLQAPAVALKPLAIRRGTDVMVLGFPLSEVLGRSLKSVRGSIFGFEDDRERGVVLYDATTNPGNSGGPVCDNTGCVIAVHFAGRDLSQFNHSSGKLGLGIPVEKAISFIRETVPDIQTHEPDARLEWPAIDEQVSRSTVFIRVFDRGIRVVVRAPAQRENNVYEDRTCVVCKGRRQIPCPVKGCYRGSVSDFENSYTVLEQGYGLQTAIRFQKPKLASCPGCRGAGIVDCPHCQDGTDPRLK